MKKLLSVLLPSFLLACSGNPPPNVDVDISKICALCPKPETPPPTVEVKYEPVCSDTLKTGCWTKPDSTWLYVPCTVCKDCPPPSTDPCSNVTCKPDETCKLGICVKNPPPPTSSTVKDACGLDMPNGVSAFVRAKAYGQGVDTELNVLDWPALCYFIHGTPANPNQCHLEGLDAKGYSRVACEMAIIETLSNGAGKCPVGLWRSTSYPNENKCLRNDPYSSGGMSCDHFGNTVDRDDPNTPNFEGKPVECAAYKDEEGDYKAGFFWIAHGDGEIKACLPDYTGCSRQWLRVVH